MILFCLVAFGLPRVFRYLLRHGKGIAKLTHTRVDDVMIKVMSSIGTCFYISVALFVATRHLSLPTAPAFVVKALFLWFLVYEGVRVIEVIVMLTVKARQRHSSPEEETVSSAIVLLVRIILWTIGLLLILSNLGINVTSLIASLGIGGLAISLALQNVFADLFSSFCIALDKPFKEGDFLIIGEHMGTVKKIGLKTTRITALGGEELVVSNQELTNTRIQNFKKMQRRRVIFKFGVTYGTSTEKLNRIPQLVEDIITKKEVLEFDRAHFKEFGDFSLNFEIVYYVLSNDYLIYMQSQHEINTAIIDAFDKHSIEMAFPTQTVHVVKDHER